jgi:hypothetical protein
MLGRLHIAASAHWWWQRGRHGWSHAGDMVLVQLVGVESLEHCAV